MNIIILSDALSSLSVFVTWDGAIVSGPELIYHDEILIDAPPFIVGDPYRQGALVCRTDTELLNAAWRFPTTFFVPIRTPSSTSIRNFQQIRMSRIHTDSLTDPAFNGLWVCKVEGPGIPIGLFARGQGEYHGLGEHARAC